MATIAIARRGVATRGRNLEALSADPLMTDEPDIPVASASG